MRTSPVIPLSMFLVASSCGGPTRVAADSAVSRAEPASPARPRSMLEIEPLLGGAFAEGARLHARGAWAPARAKLLEAAASEPTSERVKAARLVAALSAARAGDPRSARSELEALALEWPLIAPVALAHAAAAALDAGDPVSAEALATRIEPTGAWGPMAAFTLADAAFARGDWALAEARYGAILADARSGRRPYARYRRGEAIARQLGPDDRARRAEAIRELRAVWVAAPTTRLARDAEQRIAVLSKRLPARERARLGPTADQEIRRANALADAQKNEEAETAYVAVLRRLPSSSPARCDVKLRLAESVMRQRDRRRAAPLFEDAARACRDREEEARALFLAGKMLSSAGKHEEALERFAEVESRHRDSRFADDARLQAALSDLAMGRKDAFRHALQKLPGDYPAGDMRSEAMWQLAWHAWREGHDEAVLEALDALDGISPRESGWYAAGRSPYWRGRALAKLGRSDEAVASYRRAVTEAPLSYYMLLALARIAELRPGETAALWSQLVAPTSDQDGAGPTRPPLPDDPGAGLPAEPAAELAASDGFRRALLLMAAGLGDLAAKELRVLGLDGSDATEENLWLAAYLFDRAGDASRSHEILRRRLTRFEASYPKGPARRAWLVAYPRAFADLVEPAAREHGVPEAMVYAIVREESGFDPRVESWANAVGLTQLMPGTARRFAAPLGLTVNAESLRDPQTNLRIGVAFMAFLWSRFAENPLLVPAGYNAGEGAVTRWLDGAAGAELDELVESIPYDQTRGYTKRVVESYGRYLALYGTEPPIHPLRLPSPSGG